MRLRSERRHGTCWSCKRRLSVREDGRVRRHQLEPGVYCKGGNTMPLESVA